MNRRPRGDRGEATTEMVLVVPVLMLLVFLVVQFGLWYHANNVAEAAAQEGARSARLTGGTDDAGQTRAAEFMHANAPSLVEVTSVTATRTDDTVRVEITGTLAAIVPGINLPVHAEAESPIEQFHQDDT